MKLHKLNDRFVLDHFEYISNLQANPLKLSINHGGAGNDALWNTYLLDPVGGDVGVSYTNPTISQPSICRVVCWHGMR